MNSFKLAIRAVIFFGAFSLITKAEITSASSMNEVNTKIQTILLKHKPEDILAAFDIDMTLLQFKHPAVYYPALKRYLDIYKNILGSVPNVQKDIANTLLVYKIPSMLVEENTPDIVANLQDQGIKVIAFTATLTGPLLKMRENTIVLREQQLQKHGIDFSKGLNDLDEIQTFSDFEQYAGSYPMFYRGVLSSNGEGIVTKGQALIALLNAIKTGKNGFLPKVIIMIDDKRKHLLDVEEKLKVYHPDIEFIGIEYQGAYDFAPQEISREDFQKFWEELTEQARAAIF